MYNYSYKVKYKNEQFDNVYRKQVLDVFYLKKYNDDKISVCLKNIYEVIKNYKQIQLIIDKVKAFKYAKIFIIDENERNLYLIFLFSFEYFDFFHNCLKELNENKIISEKTFNILMNALDEK